MKPMFIGLVIGAAALLLSAPGNASPCPMEKPPVMEQKATFEFQVVHVAPDTAMVYELQCKTVSTDVVIAEMECEFYLDLAARITPENMVLDVVPYSPVNELARPPDIRYSANPIQYKLPYWHQTGFINPPTPNKGC